MEIFNSSDIDVGNELCASFNNMNNLRKLPKSFTGWRLWDGENYLASFTNCYNL